MRREAANNGEACSSSWGSGSGSGGCSPASSSASSSAAAAAATSELEDQIAALLRSEPAYSPSTCGGPGGQRFRAPCVLDGPGGPPVPHDEWRARIADWSYRVVDHFRYDREVVSVSMNYFDRFLLLTKKTDETPVSPTSATAAAATGEDEIDSRTYQLAAMTSLYLAVKLHGEQPEESPDASSDPSTPKSSSSGAGSQPASPGRQLPPPENRRKRRRRRRLRLLSFVELSRGQFRADDITGMESRMLETLRWRVNPPTPMVFVSYLLRLLPATPPPPSPRMMNSSSANYGMTEAEYRDVVHEEQQRHDLVLHILHELSRYLAELSVCLSDVSAAHDPSTLAYAAVIVSAECLTSEALPPALLDDFLADLQALSSKLTRDNPDVVYLAARMREAFLPELLLDGNAGASSEGGAVEGTGHPIAIAREAGLLDVDALYGSDEDENDNSATHADDSSYDEYCDDYQDGRGGSTKNKRRRNPSSNCVIQEAAMQSLRGSPKRPDKNQIIEDEEHDSPVCVSKVCVSRRVVNVVKPDGAIAA